MFFELLLCLIVRVVFVLRPRRRGHACWFLHGRVFGTVRSVPSKAGRSRVFETFLEMIFFVWFWLCVFFFKKKKSSTHNV